MTAANDSSISLPIHSTTNRVRRRRPLSRVMLLHAALLFELGMVTRLL
ncbi:MAG TPA: hypothetical protein VFR62_06520 [Gemmatimonadales bacterium]|nr:hypothetical protein [Gemmatimonadales bacterium]